MKTYNTQAEVEADVKDGMLFIDDDVTFNCDIDIRVNIKADNIIAYGIKADNITANDIRAYDINAYDINAGNIKAGNIRAYDINAGNIKAGNIKADNINAGNISYYGFCISYKDIICKSIKGRRNNSFHKCLDGKLIIKENKHIVIVNGMKIELSDESFKDLKEQVNKDN